MEQENYETSNCYSFFQAFSIKISECIQDLTQVSTSQNLARRGRGETVTDYLALFLPLRGKTLFTTLLTIHNSSLDTSV